MRRVSSLLQLGYTLFGWITGLTFLPSRLTSTSHFILRLEWDEADFDGASVLRVDPNKIWLPDLEVFNMMVNKLVRLG